MTGIREPCLLLLFSFCLTAAWSPPACGMSTMEDTQASERVLGQIGQSAEDMTGRIPEYEVCGEKLLDQMKEEADFSVWKDTGIIFNTVEEAVSFGRYFYRYIYLGKQKINIAAGESGNESTVYVQCDDPGRAAAQHRQVEARLREIAEAGAGMGEREKASFFYEWVYSNVEYDSELKKKTVYEAVIEGRSICWGYVSAYLTLCRMSGLICEPVYGGNHAWNRVQIDGRWNYCDITWDRGLGERRWKLVPEEEMEADPMHRGLL